MATYTPLKPYGSRWNYRTPSPPPSSVIEPISPVETTNDSQIILPDPSTIINLDATNYNSSLLRQNEELRSDSTLSLLSSVSPPSVASRRPSSTTMERTKGVSEVPTFAGNRYFDPLAFFADVALSSADPTTLPKLQKLAAKDAAQRLELPPAEITPLRFDMDVSKNEQTHTVVTEGTSRRSFKAPSPAVGAVDSSLSSISLSPQADILPSPPLPLFTSTPNPDGDFSDSPAKRSKTMSHNNSSLSRNATAIESSTNTEAIPNETAQEEMTVSSRPLRGKKRARGGRVSVGKVDASPTTAQKKEGQKAKKARNVTPSIALRRSTRNIKYIEEPEEPINTRHQPKAEPKHGNAGKGQSNPQRIVLHLSRNHDFPISEADVTTNAGEDNTVGLPKGTSEKSQEAPVESTETPIAQTTKQPSLSPQKLTDASAASVSINKIPVSTPVKEATDLTHTQNDAAEREPSRDKDMMSIVDEVQKQLMLNSVGVNISSLSSSIDETVESISGKGKVGDSALSIIAGGNQAVEPMCPTDLYNARGGFISGRVQPDSSMVYQRESSVDAQAIVDALQQAPPPPAMLMRMSPRQTTPKLKAVNNDTSTVEQPPRQTVQASSEQQIVPAESSEGIPLVDKRLDTFNEYGGIESLPQSPEKSTNVEDEENCKEQESEILGSNHQFTQRSGNSADSEKLQALEIVIQTPMIENSKESSTINSPLTENVSMEDNEDSADARNAGVEATREQDSVVTNESEEKGEEENTPSSLNIPRESVPPTDEMVDIPTKSEDVEDVVMSDADALPDHTNEKSNETDTIAIEVTMVDAPKLPQPFTDTPEIEGLAEDNAPNISGVQSPECTHDESPETLSEKEEPTEQKLAENEQDEPETGSEQKHTATKPLEEKPTEAPMRTELPVAAREAEPSGSQQAVAELSRMQSTEDLFDKESTDSVHTHGLGPTESIIANSESTHLDLTHQDHADVQASPAGHEADIATIPRFVGPIIPETVHNPENARSSATNDQHQPDTPPNNDLCLVCNSTTFISNDSTSAVNRSSGDATVKWIECDSCKRWTHNACVNLSNEEVDSIDKYYCFTCEKEKGPSTLLRKSARAKIPIDYESLNNGSTVPVQSATNKMYHPWVDKIINGEFKTVEEKFPRVVPEELSLRFLEDGGGFKEPLVIPAAVNPYPRKHTSEGKTGDGTATVLSQMADRSTAGPSMAKLPSTGNELFAYQKEPGIEVDALGMGFPANLNVRQIVDMVGPEETVEVIDVRTQLGDKRKWTLSKWVEYFEDPNREKVYNVISLEVSKTRLSRLIQRPKVVREMDLSDQVWPKDKRKEFPMVQYYCLMSVAHSYTDWHVDFGGSSVYYRILKGRKIFFFLAPTEENLNAYQKWNSSPEQHYTWLAEGRECYKIELGPGDTMLIPSGWLHAVYTPEDSLVIGGNFLTRLHYNTQFRIHEIEKACNTPIRYRFPKFARVHWYDAIKLTQEDPIPKNIDDQLISGKAANFRAVKGKGSGGNLSQHFLEGLPAVAEFLRRNSLIAQEIITEGLTKQKTEAVRAAIPKGFDDGWDTAQMFARWATWKRNCGEVIPPWAHPEADPAEGVPNAGQRKISAAAIKHAERLKADADRRAAGALRSGLRERNQSTQRSISGASETPAPEETRAMKKRPRLDFGEPRDSNQEPPRKKSRSQKETLDQGMIDECVDQVVDGYESSGDPIKRAIAAEVRTQYRNVHITRLGPSRSACAPCREGKTKCVHKDEIRALIAKVLDRYHAALKDNHDMNTELEEHTPQPGEYPAVDQLEQGGVLQKDSEHMVLDAPTAGTRGPSTQVVLNLNKVTAPRAIKMMKKPQSKTPRLKKRTNDLGEPRRRGGKRTACDACRKSRRKCEHGLDGAPLAVDAKSQLVDEVESDDDQSVREGTEMVEPMGETAASGEMIVEDALMEEMTHDQQFVDGPSIEEIATPSQEIATPPQEIATPSQEISMPSQEIPMPSQEISTPSQEISTPSQEISTPSEEISTPSDEISTPSQEISTPSEQLQKEQEGAMPQEHQSIVIEVDQIQPMLVDSEATKASDNLSHQNDQETPVENTTESKGTGEQGAPQFIKPNLTSFGGRGKRKRVADNEERDISEKVGDVKQGGSTNHRRLPVTPSLSGRRARGSAPAYDESRESPKRVKVDEVEASPKGNRSRNMPEKQAWQEMKAAEFGFRKRSKSKSSS